METSEKTIIGGMVAVMGMLLLAQVVQAAVPQPQYVCSLCGQRFNTYDQLYQHFTAEHPAQPIDIVWED